MLHMATRLAIFAALAACMLTITYRIETLSYQNYLRDQKLDSTIKLFDVREKIQADMFERIVELTNFATLIGQKPNINQTEYNIKAVDFVLANPDVINIAAAPDLIVKMVFPTTANKSVVGVDYRELADQFPEVKRAIEQGSTQVSGPVDLIQGGRGLILRQPVYVQDESGVRKNWGLVSVVFDYDKFIDRLGLPLLEEDYDILIRDLGDQIGNKSHAVYGNEAVLGQDPITLDFNFPFGKWQLVATPDGGWPATKPDHVSRWAQKIVLIGLFLMGLWYVVRMSDNRRRAERQLSIGIEALDHGFVMFDADRRLVAFNKKYKQLAGGSGMVQVGARYEDIVKANLREGLIPDAVGREEEWYEKWSKRLYVKSSDNEQVLEDGRLIRAYDRPMEDGSVVGLRIDITDLKKAQIAAEAANKAKTDFMGVLSHELRTPLTVILGHARLAKNFKSMPSFRQLLKELENYPDAKQTLTPKLDVCNEQIAKMMETVERSGDHLFTLISEILDFAKIDSGTLVMDLEETTTSDILDPVIDQLRPMVESKGLNLNVDLEDATLVADNKRIQQVMINLISNASKFTEAGDVSVSANNTETSIIFEVRDSGIGIPEEHISQVFEAFHQVDSTSGRKFGGTGLGLAISRDIARAHGGEISVVSEPGKGSTFTMSIPKTEPAEQPVEADAAEIAEQLVA